jgi:hypothetical protein
MNNINNIESLPSLPAEEIIVEDEMEKDVGMLLQLPGDLHRELKVAAVKRGIPLYSLVLHVLTNWKKIR